MPKRYLLPTTVLALAVLASLGLLYGRPLASYLKDKKAPTPVATSSSSIPEVTGKFKLPHGLTTYTIAQAEEVLPRIVQATIDPPDVHVGDKQKLSIVVSGPSEITSVTAYIETDHSTTTLPLNLIGPVAEGELVPQRYAVGKDHVLYALSEKQNGDLARNISTPSVIPVQTGIHSLFDLLKIAKLKIENSSPAVSAEGWPKLKYENEWIVKDTHDKTYHTVFVVKDAASHTNSITIAWSDACGIPAGGNVTIASPCTISSDDGVDNGSATITTSAMALGAKFGFNNGQSIIISGSGSIAVNANGQIIKGNIYETDSDVDNYPATATNLVTSTTAAAPYRRRYLLNTSLDCNDSDATVYQTQHLWKDNDGDGFTGTDWGNVCSGTNPPAGYDFVNDGDCDESNNTIWWTVSNLYFDQDRDGLQQGGPYNLCVGASSLQDSCGGAGRTYYQRNNVGSFSCGGGTGTGWQYLTTAPTGAESSTVDYCTATCGM